jgi:hypothetical protein
MLPPLDSPLTWFGMGVVVMALLLALGAFLIWLSVEHEKTFLIVLTILIIFVVGGPLGLLIRTAIVGHIVGPQNLPAEKP